jgi:hypothetical protein
MNECSCYEAEGNDCGDSYYLAAAPVSYEAERNVAPREFPETILPKGIVRLRLYLRTRAI